MKSDIKRYYIYNDPSRRFFYKAIDSGQLSSYVKDVTLTLCASSFFSENSLNLKRYFNNATELNIPKCVHKEINKKMKVFEVGDDKRIILQNCEKVLTDGTTTLFGEYDTAPMLLAKDKNSVVFCSNDHEAAIALKFNVPYIYLIHPDELKNTNGIKNYRHHHIKNINNLIKKIKI